MIKGIINSLTHSFFRTIGRILAYLLLGALVAMLLSSKVDAKSYAVTQSGGYNSLYYLNNSTNYNLIAGNTYYADGNLTNFRWALESTDGIYKGQYLFDFYIATDSTLNNFDCGSLTTDFQAINMVTGNWDATLISSSCVYMYDTVYNGLNAKHVLYSFDFKGKEDPLVDYANEFRFLINNGYGFISNHNFRLFYGSIYDYDSAMINSFKTTGVLEQQLQNQQGIIDNQNQNTDNIINNQNQNASDIMNNQNSNTDKVLDSNKETQDKLDENKEAINDMKDSINSNLDDKFNSCRDSYNLFDINKWLDKSTYNNILPIKTIINSNKFYIENNSTDDWNGIYINNLDSSKTYTISLDALLTYSKSDEGQFLIFNSEKYSNRKTLYLDQVQHFTYTFSGSTSLYIQVAPIKKILFSNVMLNEGSTAKEYEPYGEQICTNKLDEQTEQQKETNFSLKTLIGFLNPFSENFFAYKLVELFLNMLKSLFIPEDMSFVTEFVDALESKLGFIAAIPVKIIEFTMSLATATWSEFKTITFPSISIFGYNFWNTQEIDLTEAINIFKPFKYVTDCICVVICARTLNKWRERFTGSGGGK